MDTLLLKPRFVRENLVTREVCRQNADQRLERDFPRRFDLLMAELKHMHDENIGVMRWRNAPVVELPRFLMLVEFRDRHGHRSSPAPSSRHFVRRRLRIRE